jgi:hypothetical protein
MRTGDESTPVTGQSRRRGPATGIGGVWTSVAAMDSSRRRDLNLRRNSPRVVIGERLRQVSR